MSSLFLFGSRYTRVNRSEIMFELLKGASKPSDTFAIEFACFDRDAIAVADLRKYSTAAA